MVAVSSETQLSLGSWSNGDFAHTAALNTGAGADVDLPPEVRFLGGVAKLLQRRLSGAADHEEPSRPAIFLLQPNPIGLSTDSQPKRVPMLDNGLTPVAGRLWFVGQVVVSGKYIELQDSDDDGLFNLISGLGLGTVPAVLFDPRTSVPSVRFYPAGLDDLDNCQHITIDNHSVSLSEIYDVINKVHQQCLITPEAQPKAGKLWKENQKWWASEQAEDLVQLYLRTGLTTAFPTCTVRHEQTGIPGRLDLEIEQINPHVDGGLIRHAVLELKVLRSFGSTGTRVSDSDTLAWVDSGVRQAASYRDERGALAATLCCFDMRIVSTGEACFDHVRELAATLSVDLKAWYIFATSAQYREATTSAAVSQN